MKPSEALALKEGEQVIVRGRQGADRLEEGACLRHGKTDGGSSRDLGGLGASPFRKDAWAT
jgi:hypothetical protein